MFCNRCGATLQPQQTVCPACGQAQAPPPAASKLATHVRLLGIFWIIIGALFALGALFLLAGGTMAGAFMHQPDMPPEARVMMPMIMWGMGIFVAILTAISFLAGYGLLKRRPWARVLAIVLGFLALLHIPLGTALGIYTLIVLLPASAGQEYEQIAVQD